MNSWNHAQTRDKTKKESVWHFGGVFDRIVFSDHINKYLSMGGYNWLSGPFYFGPFLFAIPYFKRICYKNSWAGMGGRNAKLVLNKHNSRIAEEMNDFLYQH